MNFFIVLLALVLFSGVGFLGGLIFYTNAHRALFKKLEEEFSLHYIETMRLGLMYPQKEYILRELRGTVYGQTVAVQEKVCSRFPVPAPFLFLRLLGGDVNPFIPTKLYLETRGAVKQIGGLPIVQPALTEQFNFNSNFGTPDSIYEQIKKALQSLKPA